MKYKIHFAYRGAWDEEFVIEMFKEFTSYDTPKEAIENMQSADLQEDAVILFSYDVETNKLTMIEGTFPYEPGEYFKKYKINTY